MGNQFEFDDTDLAANRTGALSEKQKQRLFKEYVDDPRKSGLKVGISSLVIALLLILASVIFFKSLGATVIATGIFAVLAGAVGFLSLRSASDARKIDISKITVKRIEGPVRIDSGRGDDYYLHVAKREFEIDENLADKMNEGDTYSVYFLNSNRRVLSVEAIPQK